jgi:hypothetical protein
MSALLALAAAPASAQSRSGQQRAIDIVVSDLGLPGTFRVLINDRGLVFGTDASTGANFLDAPPLRQIWIGVGPIYWNSLPAVVMRAGAMARREIGDYPLR